MRGSERWLVLPGLDIVGHAFLCPFVGTVSVRWLRVHHSAFCVRLGKVGFVYLRFLPRFWVSQVCSRHVMAYSILCFVCGYTSHVWRILNKGTLHQEGECVLAIKRFQCVADQVWVLLVAVRDQVPITNSVVFGPFTVLCSCSRLLVAWSAM